MVVARANQETRLKMCRMRHKLPTTTRFVVLWQNPVNETMVKHARNKKRRAGRVGKVKLKVSHVKSACCVCWVVGFGLAQLFYASGDRPTLRRTVFHNSVNC